MQIGIQWQYGFMRIKIQHASKMESLFQQIGEKIHVDPKYLSLYFDHNFNNRVPDRSTVVNSGLSDKMIVYLKSTFRIPKGEICKQTERTDKFKDYLAPGETEMTPEMARIQRDFSKFTISSHFIEHRNALKPHIDLQSESSCYAFRVGNECMTRFQSIALQSRFSNHRIGLLFGRINEITGKVTAHVLMEPSQENKADEVIIKNHEDIQSSVFIAKLFKMKCVGMAISHQPDDKFPMTSYMVRMAAHFQNLFGEYFTTLVVMPRGENDVVIEAFQVSDAAMRIDQENLFEDTNHSNNYFNNYSPKIVRFKEPLDTCNVNRTEADVNLLLCAVRVRLTKSKFISHLFPSPSQNPTNIDLKMYFHEKEFAPTWYQLFDFNLLLFIYENFILSESEIREVVDDIINMRDVPEVIMQKIYITYKDIQ